MTLLRLSSPSLPPSPPLKDRPSGGSGNDTAGTGLGGGAEEGRTSVCLGVCVCARVETPGSWYGKWYRYGGKKTESVAWSVRSGLRRGRVAVLSTEGGVAFGVWWVLDAAPALALRWSRALNQNAFVAVQ